MQKIKKTTKPAKMTVEQFKKNKIKIEKTFSPKETLKIKEILNDGLGCWLEAD